MTVSKRRVAVCAVAFLAMVGARCASPAPDTGSTSATTTPATSSATTSQAGTAEPATDKPPMDAFLDAIREKDRQKLLAFFSTTQPFRYVGTITNPPQVTEITFSQLQQDLERQAGWYDSLLGVEGEDSFRDWTTGDDGRRWTAAAGNRYVRWQADGKDSVYVEWRREGDRWVISAIAEPSA